jgi:hypothetical protein
MRKLGVFTALALSGMTSACAERLASPAMMPKPAPAQAAEFKSQPNTVEPRRQAKKVMEDTRKHSAIRVREVLPSPSLRPEQRPAPQARLPQVSPGPQEPLIGRDLPLLAALPPRAEPAEANFPVAALMPPPPEPAEPTLPSAPPPIKLPSPAEPIASNQPEALPEAAMPDPPDPAEPIFLIAALMPPPPTSAEPSLPSQEEFIAESQNIIPLPEPPSYLSLRPRFDWVDTVGAIEVPPSARSEALETSSETPIPSLVRDPWPLPIDAS